MKLTGKSPLWKWHEVAKWLFKQDQLVKKDMVNNAEFIEHINAVLEERNECATRFRKVLLKKIAFTDSSSRRSAAS